MENHRIKLINCDAVLLEKVLEGDEFLADYLQINIPERWTEFGAGIFQFSLDKINLEAIEERWLAYLPILKGENMLIGSCGYHGPPNEKGAVEVGYEVAEDYRNQGYASEILQLLVENAFCFPEVQTVVAHTLAKKNPSTRILEKSGFEFETEIFDELEGKIWKWVLKRKS